MTASSDLTSRVRGSGRAALSTIASRAVDVGFTYGFYALLARALPAAGFGDFIYCLTLAQLGSIVSALGLDQALVAVAPRGGLNRFAFRRVAAVSACIAVLAGLIARIVWNAPPYALWLAALVPLQSLGQLIIAALRASGRVTMAASAEGIAQPATAFFLAAAASRFAPSASAFAIALLLSWVVAALYAFRLQWRGDVASHEDVARLTSAGRSMLGSIVVHRLSASADIVLLGLLSSSRELARYAAAQKIATGFLLLHGAVTSALAPFIRDLASDRELLTAYYRMAVRWTFSAALPLIVLTIGAPQLILRIFGSGFTSSATPLVILSIAALGYLLSGPAGSVLLCTGKTQRMFVIMTAGAVVMVLAVAAAAPLGAIGVACAVLGGTWLTRFLLVLEVRRILHTSFVDSQLLMIGACAAAGVVACRLMSAVGAIPAASLGCALALLGGALVLRRAGDLTFLTRM